MILIGDSHAGAVAPSLLDALRPVAGSLDVLTWGGCPVIFDVEYVTVPDGQIACHDRNEFVRRLLLDSPRSTVVYLARMPLWLDGTRFDNGEGGVEAGEVDLLAPLSVEGDRSQALSAAVTATLREILGMEHRLILVYPIPEVGWDVPRAARALMPMDAQSARQWLSEPHLTTSLDRYEQRSATTRQAYDAVGDDEALVRIYPSVVFCDDATRRCRTYDENAFFYSDDDHLSAAGAALLVRSIVEASTLAR